MTVPKLLLSLIAPLCFAAACATSDEPAADQTEAELAQPGAQTQGASCTVLLPYSWHGPGVNCIGEGGGSHALADGNSLTFTARGGGLLGTGQCTVTCSNGVLHQDSCICRKVGGPP